MRSRKTKVVQPRPRANGGSTCRARRILTRCPSRAARPAAHRRRRDAPSVAPGRPRCGRSCGAGSRAGRGFRRRTGRRSSTRGWPTKLSSWPRVLGCTCSSSTRTAGSWARWVFSSPRTRRALAIGASASTAGEATSLAPGGSRTTMCARSTFHASTSSCTTTITRLSASPTRPASNAGRASSASKRSEVPRLREPPPRRPRRAAAATERPVGQAAPRRAARREPRGRAARARRPSQRERRRAVAGGRDDPTGDRRIGPVASRRRRSVLIMSSVYLTAMTECP